MNSLLFIIAHQFADCVLLLRSGSVAEHMHISLLFLKQSQFISSIQYITTLADDMLLETNGTRQICKGRAISLLHFSESTSHQCLRSTSYFSLQPLEQVKLK